MAKQRPNWILLLITACLLWPRHSLSQTLLPPDQPEQDACHALSICGGQFFTPYSYQGIGRVSDLTTTPCGSGEDNSMWIRVTIKAAGELSFRIIPKDTADDYDFAVLDVTNTDCSNLSPSNTVRCNFNNNEFGSNPKGIVGLSDTATQDFVQGGAYGNSWIAAINATPGQVFLIMVNNFGHDDDPGPSNGFTIDFGTSTATFKDENLPTLQNIVKTCSDSSVTIQLTKPVACSSIAPDGSEFSVTNGVTVNGASGVNCVNDSGYTSEVIISFAGHYPIGDYTVSLQNGTSGTTLLDLCGNPIVLPGPSQPGGSLPFNIWPKIQNDFLKADTTKCNYSTITIGSDSSFLSYLWSSGQTSQSIGLMDPGIYTLQVTDTNTCMAVASENVIDSACPQYVFLPNAFTPNGDGKNDIFRPVFAGAVSVFRFAIYDRWGRQVFQSSSPSGGWDGTTGGNRQPAGTYVWFCQYKLYDEPERIQRGTVILIR
jgi:gliding motility-associated-like protein